MLVTSSLNMIIINQDDHRPSPNITVDNIDHEPSLNTNIIQVDHGHIFTQHQHQPCR
ncbi:predicted protein [Plenodomus lingam JN3]|uniref:Predicted protein n=1 Tax=Leptosphaeria maculans (strain JN3 / isolate v23.1.3 / race Av1-4-5-6-7-8) TaxID=985895 RepID=E4ZSV0_LEPMJ|nr:predicted protein [Plenodomus lingam JN3]CBX94538.1 predicted protein [Plenodomus lingam JN3]